ncbi:MAG: hypothetical protein AAF485_05665 [Chloroflexota bacterium]
MTNRRRILTILVVLVALLLCLIVLVIGFGLANDIQQPAPLTRTATPDVAIPTIVITETPEPQASRLEILENTSVASQDTIGQVLIDYPVRMSSGSSNAVVVHIRIPDQLVSLDPFAVEIIEIPTDAPPVVGARGEDEAIITVQGQMRVELTAPTFDVTTTGPAIQPINLDTLNASTAWNWTLIAPEVAGLHNFTITLFRNKETQPVWTRIYQVEVTEEAEPDIPLFDRPGGIALIVSGTIITLAVLGLIAILFFRNNRHPIIRNKASYQRRLKILYSNLNHLEEEKAIYGAVDIPVKLINQIKLIEAEIAELEEALEEL